MKAIKLKLFHVGPIPKEREFLSVMEFDRPKNINDPAYLNSLTPELLKDFSEQDLNVAMTNCINDENYIIAAIIKKEIDSRKNK